MYTVIYLIFCYDFINKLLLDGISSSLNLENFQGNMHQESLCSFIIIKTIFGSLKSAPTYPHLSEDRF